MGVLYARVSGQWVPISSSGPVMQWNSAWGVVLDMTITTGGDLTIGSSHVVIASGSFTAVAGRRYRVVVRCTATSYSDNSGFAGEVHVDGSSLYNIDQQVKDSFVPYPVHLDRFISGLAAGSHTISFRLIRSVYSSVDAVPPQVSNHCAAPYSARPGRCSKHRPGHFPLRSQEDQVSTIEPTHHGAPTSVEDFQAVAK